MFWKKRFQDEDMAVCLKSYRLIKPEKTWESRSEFSDYKLLVTLVERWGLKLWEKNQNFPIDLYCKGFSKVETNELFSKNKLRDVADGFVSGCQFTGQSLLSLNRISSFWWKVRPSQTAFIERTLVAHSQPSVSPCFRTAHTSFFLILLRV